MEILKELSDISLHITEPEYRQRPELSYSTLSTYETLGFTGLDHLFDKKESPSLTLGSVVDTILTGGEEEFKSLYTVLDINVTDSGIDICKNLVNQCLPFETFEEIPESLVSQAAKEVGFWQNDKYDNTRYKQVLKCGNVAEYYNALKHSDKTIISTETFQTALAMVRALRESPATAGYFADNDELSPIRRYYQLKFTANFDGVGYRNMADLLVVDYEQKKVWPIDLKTSMGCAEWDFEQNFKKWHYYIQARLYWRIIRKNMDKDEYFKDFSLEDYRFIICNPKTLTPLVWEFPLTKSIGTLIDDDGKEIRDPFEIGTELQGYLNLRPSVPNGIDQNGVNIIKCLKKK
jgi:hypothetical protein